MAPAPARVAASHADGSPLSVGPEADSASTGDTLGTASFDGDTLWRDGAGPVADSAVLWEPGEASGPVVVEVDGVLRLGLGEKTPDPGAAPRIPVAEAVGPPGVFYYEEVVVLFSRPAPTAEDTAARPDLPRPPGTAKPPTVRGVGDPTPSGGTAGLKQPPGGGGAARLAGPDSGATGRLTRPTLLALTVETFTLTFVALEPDGTRRPLALPLAAREKPGGPVRILDAGAADHGLMVRWESGGRAGGGTVERFDGQRTDLDLDCPVEVEGHCVAAPPIDDDRTAFTGFASIGEDFPVGPFGHLAVTAMATDGELVAEASLDRPRVTPVFHRCFLADRQEAVRRHRATNECLPDRPVSLARRDTARLRLSVRVDEDGPAPDSARVTVVAEPVAGSGGHAHDAGRPRGTFFPEPAPAVDRADGGIPDSVVFTLRSTPDTTLLYRSSGVGGREVLRVRAEGFGGSGREATAADTLRVALEEPLVRLSAIPGVLEAIGALPGHPSNTWGTARTVAILDSIARAFHDRTGRTLEVNDMSLRLGGLFDCAVGATSGCTAVVGEERPWRPPHQTHRRGDQVDVRNRNLSPSERRTLFRLLERRGIVFGDETATHFHTTFR